MTIVVTGANSAVGLALLRCAAADHRTETFVAAVRSDRAVHEIEQQLGAAANVRRITYEDAASLRTAFHGASAVVHLPGVLIERPGSSYEQANLGTARSVVDAANACGVTKVVLVSAIGANETSTNRYWRSKGAAEAYLRDSGLSYTVLRAPVLLGPGTEASAALKRHVSQPTVRLIGGGRNAQQPLDVDDLGRAAIAASHSGAADGTFDVVGPVSVTERGLVERAAHLLGRRVRVRSVPKMIVSCMIAARQLLGRPGLPRDALEVITADTRLDPQPAATALNITLTGLDDMIRRSLDGFTRDRLV